MLYRFSRWLEGPISRLNGTSGDRRWWIAFSILIALILMWILAAGIVAVNLIIHHAGIMLRHESIVPRDWIDLCFFITLASTPIVHITWILAGLSWNWARGWKTFNCNILEIINDERLWYRADD